MSTPLTDATGTAFVGRSESTNSLFEQFKLAQQNLIQIALISGEPGIGKTRLVEEFITQVQLNYPKIRVIRGRGYDLNQTGDAYGVMLQLLEDASMPSKKKKNRMNSKQAKFITNVLPAWLSLIPVLNIVAVGATTLASLLDINKDEIDNQTQIFQRVEQRLASFAKQFPSPIIMFIDDLQWMDASSLSALNYIGSTMQNIGLFIIGTYRSTPPPASDSTFGQVLAELERHRFCTRIELNELNKDDVRLLLSKLLPNQFPESFLTLIYERSGGNPFYIYELANLLQIRRTVRQNRNGLWQIDKTVDEQVIPQNLEDLLQQRVSILSTSLRQMCEIAAVEGSRFALVVIMSILEGEERISKTRILQGLSEIEKRFRLISHIGRQDDLDFYRFVHGLIRDTLYRSLNEPLRQHYHLLIAQQLESFEQNAHTMLAYEIASHYQGAGNLQKAVPYWVDAGEQFLSTYAVTEAIQAFDSANKGADEFLKTAKLQDPLTKDLLAIKGKALIGLSETYGVMGISPPSLKAAQEAMAIWKEIGDNAQQMKALFRIGLNQHEQQDYHQAITNFQGGLAIAETLNDTNMQGQFFRDMGNSYIWLKEYPQAYEALQRSLRIFTANGNLDQRAVTLFVLGYWSYAQADYATAIQAYAQSLQYAEKVKDEYRIGQILQIEALALVHSGRTDEAIAVGQRAVKLAEQNNIEVFRARANISEVFLKDTACKKQEIFLALRWTVLLIQQRVLVMPW